MPNEHYSNRELDARAEEIKELIAHNRIQSKDQLDRIEAQVLKTNGRVSTLERWQSYVIGFCAAISMILLPIAFTIISKSF